MQVVIAIDSFKGSLTSLEAGNAVKDAVLALYKDARVTVKPMADGGEGTVDAFSEADGAELFRVTVKGPLLKPVRAGYCILKNSGTAVIEMAAASGLPLVAPEERNPLETTSYGVGQLIRHALELGCRSFIVGIGGSATNDGGVGMLSALGYEFLDKNGDPIPFGAKGLQYLEAIKTDGALPELADCRFHIACDVTNPLCGEKGCSAVFAPQKGGTPEMIRDMDMWLMAYAEKVKSVSSAADPDHPGAGAAGGLGFAFLAFLRGELQPGVKTVLEETGLEEDIKTADLVVTGEGRLDSQTVLGKAPVGVARLAKKYGKRVIAFCGSASKDAEICNENGIDAFFPTLRSVTTLEEAMDKKTAKENLTATAKQVFRLIK